MSTHFTGRIDILQEMRERLCPESDNSRQNEQKRFVISAMGGSGKSEVCLKFAHDNRERQAFFLIENQLKLIPEQFLGYLLDRCQ